MNKKLNRCALLNSPPEKGITMAASRLYERGIRSPLRILALTFGTLLAVAPASNVIAEDLQKIGTLVISGVTQQPVPIFSAGVQYTLSQGAGGGGGGAGKAEFSVFTLSKKVDATSPILLVNSASGRRIQLVSIDLGCRNSSILRLFHDPGLWI